MKSALANRTLIFGVMLLILVVGLIFSSVMMIYGYQYLPDTDFKLSIVGITASIWFVMVAYGIFQALIASYLYEVVNLLSREINK